MWKRQEGTKNSSLAECNWPVLYESIFGLSTGPPGSNSSTLLLEFPEIWFCCAVEVSLGSFGCQLQTPISWAIYGQSVLVLSGFETWKMTGISCKTSYSILISPSSFECHQLLVPGCNWTQAQLPAAMKSKLVRQVLVKREEVYSSADHLRWQGILIPKPVSTSQWRQRFL